MENKEIYDVVIVGGGPAGFTAGIYTSRARLNTLLIEKYAYGGQMGATYEIKNYPGYDSVDGPMLTEKMKSHAISCGMKTLSDTVLKLSVKDDLKIVSTEYSGEILTKSVIICTGAAARKLEVKNEAKFEGRGVSYCAICDGAFFKDKIVAVVGGGDSAMEDSTYLSGVAKKVYLIHRRNEFRAQDVLQEKVFELVKEGKIELVLESGIDEVCGENTVNGINVKNCQTNKITHYDVDGVFVTIGRVPETINLEGLDVDEKGYILTNESMETNIKGVFAAGDCRKKELRQIITACADGAVAGTKANLYIKTMARNKNN